MQPIKKILPDGSITYRIYNGDLHREDGPAIEWANGDKEWYLNGKRHRADSPAVEYADGSKEWWVGGACHHIGGPAIEYADGYKAWYLDGERHREEGPAIEYPDGRKEWWINGKCMSFRLFKEHIKDKLNKKKVFSDKEKYKNYIKGLFSNT